MDIACHSGQLNFVCQSVIIYYYDALFCKTKQFPISCADWASLAVYTDSGPSSEFCAIYNPADVSVTNTPLFSHDLEAVQPPQDVFGCVGLSSHNLSSIASVTSRGNCTFVEKALVAESAGADLLVVVYNESKVLTVPDLQVQRSESVNITVLLISNISGQKLTVSTCV